jgi:hypothetical protein
VLDPLLALFPRRPLNNLVMQAAPRHRPICLRSGGLALRSPSPVNNPASNLIMQMHSFQWFQKFQSF